VHNFRFRRGEANLFTIYKQHIGQYFQQHRVVSIAVGHVVVLTVLAVALLGGSLGKSLIGVFAQAACSAGDQAHIVMSGESLSTIAMNYDINWQELAQHNNISNPNMIYASQTLCVPGAGEQNIQPPASSRAPIGYNNLFPYGQCTYWADERYHRLAGVYVPWVTNSNAWQWTTRANQYGWNVSSRPISGAIMVLQAWVQGAGGYGHVGVVEKVLGNGHVLTSNMNWGGGIAVTYVEFSPGPGVTFVTH
jgi:N-acetylmuramoyl-L-alanine amidase